MGKGRMSTLKSVVFKDDDVFRLIELWKERPVLWQPMHAKHYRPERREDALKEVAEAMNDKFSTQVLSDRMEYLRGYFRRIYNGVMKTGVRPRWIFYDHLAFLISVLKAPSPQRDESSIDSYDVIKREDTNSDTEDESSVHVPPQKIRKVQHQPGPSGSRQSGDSVGTHSSQGHSKTHLHWAEEDEDVLWSQYILKKIQGMDDYNKQLFKCKIEQFLLESMKITPAASQSQQLQGYPLPPGFPFDSNQS